MNKQTRTQLEGNYDQLNEIVTATTDEFRTAVTSVISCRANLTCGVNMTEEDKMQADWLYYQCKRYCEDYKDFLNREK